MERATTAPDAVGPRNPAAVAGAHHVIAPPRIVGFIKREDSARTISSLRAKRGTRGGRSAPTAPAMHVETEPICMLRNTRELLSVSNSELAHSWDDYAAAQSLDVWHEPPPPRRATNPRSALQSVREQNSDLNLGMAASGAAHDGSPSGVEGMHLTFVCDGDASAPLPSRGRPFLPIRMPTVKVRAPATQLFRVGSCGCARSLTSGGCVRRKPIATLSPRGTTSAERNPSLCGRKSAVIG